MPFDRTTRAGDARASDLQLTNALARGRRDVSRGTRGLEPMPDAALAGDEVGALFELYDLPVQDAYQLRAELVPSAGGTPIALEMRPAWETRFGTSFARTRWPEAGRVAEYLTLRLIGVAPGAYTLRVVAYVAGAGAVVTERAVERR
ncbi:MAG: hypothetical protein EXR95_00895 [Gemmatimonadetes bacterium]|nr:hypothetical protein [Gemmatimonadota bacterium]